VDEAVHSILTELASRGAWERTALVLTSDHGEAFGEHHHTGHGTSLYEEQVRIPLLFRIPGVPGKQLDTPVAAIDATATMAHLAGASTTNLDGVSLLASLRDGRPLEPRPIFLELHRYKSSEGKLTHGFKAVVLGDRKLIWDRRRRTVEFFDLANDPDERQNSFSKDSSEAMALDEILRSFVGQAESKHPLPVAEPP
jgi:arylsulfatase A-like enzyme